ncbi:small ubiquitin-related modifier 1-like isoform X2 [Phoenix dactylifera]|uniref:Small ubiquitin-related modifier n=1 Tax=Phoenix dactylifera TaxID=42345 RepID=A0A8B8ZJ27_PHODC|nr:small ubiquitin-related modifier 1-like isoform X2 [Phoenix dactylifera]
MSVVMAKEDNRRFSERSSRINIKIVSNDGYDSVTVRVKRSVKMKDLMKAYNDRRSVDSNTFEFLLDGHRIQGEQTPDELEMKDGDEIDAMVHGHGGSFLLLYL